MKDLLNEWKKYLVEQSGNQETTVDPKTGDITLSDDSYAGLVLKNLYYIWNFSDRSDSEINHFLDAYKSREFLMYYSQYKSAIEDVREIHKIFFDLIQSIKDKKLRKKLIVRYDKNNKADTVKHIVQKRLEASFDTNLWSLIDREIYNLIYKQQDYRHYTIEDYKKDPKELLSKIKRLDELTKGCADLINNLKKYKKLAEMDDADEMKSTFIEMFVNGVSDNPLNLPQLESFLASLY